MNNEEIRKRLFELQDEKYKKFHTSLCPGINNIIGVRAPKLKELAKQIAKENYIEYLKNPSNEYYEEIMLQGLVIGLAKNITIEEIIKYLKTFIPKVNNWAICDMCIATLKTTKKNQEIMWKFLQKYLKSNKEFEKRFAIVMFLNYYLNDEYIDKVLLELDNIKSEQYYVKMAIAWAISTAYIKQPEKTKVYLKNNNLDDFTYNKAIQKIMESLRVTKEEKEKLKKMKRK